MRARRPRSQEPLNIRTQDLKLNQYYSFLLLLLFLFVMVCYLICLLRIPVIVSRDSV